MENSVELQNITKSLESKTLLYISIVTVFLSLLTAIENVFVIVAFTLNPKLQTITNLFILSLACADTVIGLVSMNLFSYYLFKGRWTLGPLACDLWLCIDYVASNASVMNLLVISIDRCLALKKPMSSRRKRSTTRACGMIAIAWLVSIIAWVPAILLWPALHGEKNLKNGECYLQFIDLSPTVTITTAVLAFYLPVLVMITLNYHIYCVHVEHKKFSKNFQLRPLQSGDPCRRRVNRKLNAFYSQNHYQTTKNFSEVRGDTNSTQPGTIHTRNHSQVLAKQKKVVAISNENNFIRVFSSNSGPVEFGRKDSHEKTIQIPLVASSLFHTACKSISRKLNDFEDSASEYKILRLLIFIILTFVITWAPYNILVVISTFCNSCINDTLWKASYWLCYMNSALNPACYAFCDQEFRKTFRHLMVCQNIPKNKGGQILQRHCRANIASKIE